MTKHSRVALVAAVVSVAALVAACSNEDRPAAGGSSGSTSGGGLVEGGVVITEAGADTGDASADDAGRPMGTGLVQRSQVHQELGITGAAPSPMGGTITVGTYVFNELSAFDPDGPGGSDPPPPGPTGRIGRSTLVVTATTMEFLEAEATEPADPPPDTVRGASYRVVGTSLELTPVCPQPGAPATVPFTASGTYLTLHLSPARIAVYLRKP